jgi:hypothetical protein
MDKDYKNMKMDHLIRANSFKVTSMEKESYNIQIILSTKENSKIISLMGMESV